MKSAAALCMLLCLPACALGEEPLSREVRRAAGLGPITEQPAGGGDEVRIWIHTSRTVNPLIVLRESAKGVAGDVVYWWGKEGSRWLGNPAAAEYVRALRESNLAQRKVELANGRCMHHAVRDLLEACRVALREAPGWARLLAELDAAGLRELPDGAGLKTRVPPGQIADGVTLAVELRRGGKARTYRYSNPDNIIGPEALSAKRILEISWKFLESAR